MALKTVSPGCGVQASLMLSLGANSSEAPASRDHYFLVFFFFFLAPDCHELWCSVMSTCLIPEVKQQWANLVLGWVTTSVHYSCP